ncbi:MAG: hypothetical protein ACUVSU_14550 [Aggregatilineaceae bacterium]
MHGSVESILWEDLSEVQSRIGKALAVLQALEHAIQEGKVDQPTHQDSKRINRLMVLADLLYAELRPWTEELVSSNNGHRPASSAAY